MKIGILGSGMVAQALGAKLAESGHEVMLGTRTPLKLQEWAALHPGAKIGSFKDCAAHGELLFNATSGTGSLAALGSCDESDLNGKILIDISNPLDFSRGMPPTLFVSNDDSLGEQIQRAFPHLKVVKTFNTLNANLMVDPHSLADGDHTLFLSGNDPEAKVRVSELLTEWFGWQDIIDLGDITTSRGTEAYLLLWVRLFMKFGTPYFQIKIVR